MSNAGGYISSPVTLADIRAVLHRSDGRLSLLVQNGDINPFSKYKPIRRSDATFISQEGSDGEWNASADWWKNTDGKCGLSFEVSEDPGDPNNTLTFLGKLKAGQLGWSYARPRGLSYNEPYRILDWLGYNHNASPVVGDLGSAGGTITVSPSPSGVSANFSYEVPDSFSDDNLTLSDFSHKNVSFRDYRLGILMWKGNGSPWIVVTSENAIGDSGSADVKTKLGYDDVGTWNIIPFLTDQLITRGGSLTRGNYLSAGHTTADTIHIVRSSSYGPDWSLDDCSVFGEWAGSGTRVDYEIVLGNNASGTMTYSQLKVMIYIDDPRSGDNIITQTITNVSVPENSSRTVTGSITVRKQSGHQYFVVVSGSNNFWGYNAVEDDEFDPGDDPIDDDEPMAD